MAEIRCPMCGKPNPDHLDICQFCEARLKPLTASLPSDAAPPNDTTPEKPEPSSDLPDWLNFDTDSQLKESDETAFSDAAPFDDDDDWLSRLDSDSESEESSPFQPGAEPPLEQSEETVEGEFPTWLSADEGSDKSRKLPDWMIDSSSTDKDADPSPAAETDLSEEGNEEITPPDRTSDHQGAEAGSELSATDDNSTFFSTGYVGQETVPNQDIQGDMDLPDWLNDSKATVGEGDSLEEIENEIPATESDLPDWLSDPGGEETEEAIPSQASTPAFAADDADELPGWLNGEDDAIPPIAVVNR